MLEKVSLPGLVRRVLEGKDRSVNLIVLSMLLVLMAQVSDVVCNLFGVDSSVRVVLIVFAGLAFVVGLRMYCEGE